MATHDVQDERIANERTGVAASERRAGWFVEFSYGLLDMSLSLKRAFIIISAIGLGAMATAYLGANTGHYYIAAAALAVFGLAVVAWTVAIVHMLWKVGVWAVRWRTNRLTNQKPIGSGTE